jgi:serine/threonine protein kinase/tetratricopeptide (TPR) repeat protein
MSNRQDPELPSGPDPAPHGALSPDLRDRIAGDLAAGRTVALPREVLADPELRGNLPAMIESLQPKERPAPTALTIPGYRIVCEIGQGGMSTVYLAVQERLHRHVALKVVPHWLGGGERARQRLLAEARALAQLAHPNIVAVHDVVHHGDVLAIAMDWVDGLSLAGLLQQLPSKAEPLDTQILCRTLGTPPEDAERFAGPIHVVFARMMERVARAVQHVHDHKLLHLDIKPSNVLVHRSGTPLLADFGVVRELGGEWSQTRSFAGTPMYAAPEQLRRADREIGPHTDVYGLGVTLYELLARRHPLRDQDVSKVLQNIQAGRFPPLEQLAQVPKPLANIVHRAIAPVPRDRCPTAAAFADDLRAFLDGGTVTARPTSLLDRARWWGYAQPWQAALLALLLVALGTGGFFGVRLWQALPRLAQIDRDAGAKAVAPEVDYALQLFLVRQELNAADLAKLKALARDWPTHPDLFVAITAVLSRQEPANVLPQIDAAERAGLRTLGTRLARQRAVAGRWFFTPEEIATLRTSPAEVDILLRLVDRALWARNTMVQGDFASAASDLEREVQATEPKALLHGLRAFAAALAKDRKAVEASCYALAKNWPDAPSVVAWQATAWQEIDRDQARSVLEAQIAAHPDDRRAYLLLARTYSSDGSHAAELATIDRLIAHIGRPEPYTNLSRAMALARLGRRDEARSELAAAGTHVTAVDRLAVLKVLDPEAAQREYLARAAAGSLTFAGHSDAERFAVLQRNTEFIESIARSGVARFPEFLAFRWRLAEVHWRRKDYAVAATLVRDLEVPTDMLDNYGPYLAEVWRSERDWPRLRHLAEDWLGQHTDREYAAEYHLGVALSRLGQRESARPHLARHIELAATNQTKQSTRPYREAYLEQIWLDLDPQQPNAERRRAAVDQITTRRRDLDNLADGGERVRNGPPTFPSAFWTLVRAELFAFEGKSAAAKEEAQKARVLCAKGMLAGAPTDLEARIDDLLARLQ